MDEQRFVAEQFQKAFADQQEKDFVLYGIGKNTVSAKYWGVPSIPPYQIY